MNKNDLATAVAIQTGIPIEQVSAVVSAVFSTISNQMVEGASVKVPGFGTFSAKNIAGKYERTKPGQDLDRDPPSWIPSHAVPFFRAGSALNARFRS